jgi:hypothetical protein
VTFVRPSDWIAAWKEVPHEEALRDVFLRYLGTHGPATREEFARWWGFSPARANDLLETVNKDVVVLNRDGDAVYLLRKDAKELHNIAEDADLRVLGLFDAYVLAGLPHDEIVPKKHKDKVLTTGAWVQRTVLRGGRVVGVWKPTKKGAHDITLFDRSVPKRQVESLIKEFPVASAGSETGSVG